MVIKYSKLSTGEGPRFDYAKWAKSQIPVAFLRQQIFLVYLVAASSVLLIIATFFIPEVDYELIQDSSYELNYGVIVDCGSSGTRAHIFRWKRNPFVRAEIELVRDRSTGKPLNKHITPGLSSLKDDPDYASEYMEPIMNFISESIPRDRHLDTPIYFMATAGLRLLDNYTQKKILADITRGLRAKFDFPRIKSQVISGEFEGIYSWLSLNVKKKFQNVSSKSYGMIEMGGASTQVAFELNPEVENAILKNLKNTDAISAFRNEQVTINLSSNSSVKLFAATFLGLGVNSARQAAIDLLVKDYLNATGETDSKLEVRLKDPCLTLGSSEIERKPMALLKNNNQTIGFVIKPQEETFEVRLEGTGNFLNCIDLLERVLHIVKRERLNCSPTKRACSMALLGTNFIPYSHYEFIGLSEMFFTTHEMMNSSGIFSRPKILHETLRICSTQYNTLLETYSKNGVSQQDRILYECFKASWLLTILHDSGFNMPVNYDNYQTVNELDGEEIDWTVGAMIKEVALDNVISN